ncbi:MAG: sodium:proton antiporter [Buchananella hordeovulneris]|nr:sodium:proton antiporter [Buchananella hordeovulneris]
MTVAIVVTVVALLVIAFSEPLGEQVGIVAPVVLLLAGTAVSFVPGMPTLHVDPELVLHVILPPLVFATAVAMPVQDFRRNIGSISLLSVVLVLATALLLGFIFSAMTGMPLALGIALGTIMSPTDTVATIVVRKQGVSERLVTILEGEGLINDASALVILRSALAATAGAVSFWQMGAEFLWAVAGACVVGWIMGRLSVWLRSLAKQPTTSTIISLTVPFLAAVPAEQLRASGLVAAVVAGLVTSKEMARRIPPAHRLNARQTWETVGLVLESAVFLIMGLQASTLLGELWATNRGLGAALALAGVALVVTLSMRALIVFPLISGLRRNAQRKYARAQRAGAVTAMIDALEEGVISGPGSVEFDLRRLERIRFRLARRLSDAQYYQDTHLGGREGALIWWSGMRGGVTLAAAQTLPFYIIDRALFLFAAFAVSAVSLIVQGGSLNLVVRVLRPQSARVTSHEERQEVRLLVHAAGQQIEPPAHLREWLGKRWHSGAPAPSAAELCHRIDVVASPTERDELKVEAIEWALARIRAERLAIIEQRDAGKLDAGLFNHTLGLLDADEVRHEMHLDAARAGMEDLVED